MRDVVKHQSQSENKNRAQSPRKRRQRRNLSLYYATAFIIILIVGIVLSLTVLFTVSEINVEGDSVYTSDEIISASGVNVGANLIRLNTSKAEKTLLKQKVYLDTAEVRRVFPDKVLISVTPSVVFANVKTSGGYLIISEKGKILGTATAPTNGIPVVVGFETVNTEPGDFLLCEDTEKQQMFDNLCAAMVKNETVKGITEINVTDRYNISLEYDDRITIELGSQNELEYKLNYSYMLVTEKISIKKTGVLYMRGSNTKEASFVEDTEATTVQPTQPDESTSETDIPQETSEGGETTAQTTAPSETTTAETTVVTETAAPPVGIVPST